MYSLNHTVRSGVLGSLRLVNQHFIYVFLFNTPNNEVKHSYMGPFDEGEAGDQGPDSPPGDPGVG